MSISFNQDFREFLGFLASNGVEYLVIGGYAVAAHGHPRYTKDLDVWIRPSLENGSKVISALKEFGFGSVGLTPEDFVAPDAIIQLGYPPRRIDLLTEPSGVEFGECFAGRLQVEIEGMVVDFIGLDGLRANKLASGRPQDLADLDNLP